MVHPSPVLVRTALTVSAALALSGCATLAAEPGQPIPTTPPPGSATSERATTTPSATGSATAPVSQATIVSQLPGSAGDTCVVPQQRNARSGTIGAGDFNLAQVDYKAGTGIEASSVTLHVIPSTPGSMAGMTLKATRQRKSAETATFTNTDTGIVNGTRYYVMTFPISLPGVWRLEFTSGADKGCFDVAFNRPKA